MLWFMTLPLAVIPKTGVMLDVGMYQTKGKPVRVQLKSCSCPCNVKLQIQSDSKSKRLPRINVAEGWVTPLQLRPPEWDQSPSQVRKWSLAAWLHPLCCLSGNNEEDRVKTATFLNPCDIKAERNPFAEAITQMHIWVESWAWPTALRDGQTLLLKLIRTDPVLWRPAENIRKIFTIWLCSFYTS